MSEKPLDVPSEGRLPPRDPPRITPREREILRLIAEGLTDQEIAQRLWISRGTVRTHLVHLREKLQVHNRTALVRAAQRLDLLRVEAPKSTLVWIGEPRRPGYTDGQEAEPHPSPTHSPTAETGGEASADLQGDVEMLNRNVGLWFLAALLAAGTQHSAAAAEPSTVLSTPRTPLVGDASGNGGAASGLQMRRIRADGEFSGTVSSVGLYAVSDGEGALAVHDLATGESRRLENLGAGEVWTAAISSDGKQVAYAWHPLSGGLDLRIVQLDGSQPRLLYRNKELDDIQPHEWSPDGRQVLALFHRRTGGHQIALVSAVDGATRVLKSLDNRAPQRMSFSPDGRTIAYDFPVQKNSPSRDIYLLAADGSRETVLVQHAANDLGPVWTPDGKQVLFISDRGGSFGVWITQVVDGKPHGAPELVKGDMGILHPLGFSRDGTLYYSLLTGKEDIYTATLDPLTGQLTAPPAPANPRYVGYNRGPAWSPDGRYLAYLTQRNYWAGGTPYVLSILSCESREVRELSLSLQFAKCLSWSPDGRFLRCVGVDAETGKGAYRIHAKTGAVTRLRGPTTFMREATWSRDGKVLVYAAGPGEGIWARDLITGQDKELYRGTAPSAGKPALESPPRGSFVNSVALSPDGRQLAFSEQQAGESWLVKIVPAGGGEPRELCRLQGPGWFSSNSLAWTPDGHQLLFGWAPAGSRELWSVATAGGTPQRLGMAPPALRGMHVHPDGRQIAFTAGRSSFEIWVMENFLPPAQTVKSPAPRR